MYLMLLCAEKGTIGSRGVRPRARRMQGTVDGRARESKIDDDKEWWQTNHHHGDQKEQQHDNTPTMHLGHSSTRQEIATTPNQCENNKPIREHQIKYDSNTNSGHPTTNQGNSDSKHDNKPYRASAATQQ
jgi:hypothetical protein